MINKNYINKYFEFMLSELNSLDYVSFHKKVKSFTKIKLNKKIILLEMDSAAMSSHVSVDLTKQCGIRAINFNEADLITCFANDYGHDN